MKNRRENPADRGDDVAAIRQLAMHWRAGWLAGDADALVALYASRPVLMPQGQPAIRSKDAIRSIYRAILDEVRIESTGAVQEIVVSGDWGYFWSTYSLRAVPKSGGVTIRSKGKSIFIVRRQRDGSWKIARLIDNSDT